MGAIHNGANCLDIGMKHPLGLVVCMTDVVPGRRLLLTEITPKGHGNDPPKSIGFWTGALMLAQPGER